jgi:hypothetical protein
VPRKKKNQQYISYVIVREQLVSGFVTWVIISWTQATAMKLSQGKSYISAEM